MAGLLDVVIHQYDAVDPAVVWRTVHEDLPDMLPLLARLQLLLEEREDEDWEHMLNEGRDR